MDAVSRQESTSGASQSPVGLARIIADCDKPVSGRWGIGEIETGR